jgi:hypothetical protein
MELERELNDGDKSSDVNPVRHLLTKQLTKFFKHFDTGIGITYDNDAKRERNIKPEQLRVLWLVTENSIVRGKKLHFNSLSITSSRELKVVNSPGSAREPVQPDHAPHYQVSYELPD